MRILTQSQSSDCGITCLAMLASHYGKPFNLDVVRSYYCLGDRGTSIDTLSRVASDHGLEVMAYKCDLEVLRTIDRPVILHWDLNHFVVLRGLIRDKYRVVDPQIGEIYISHADMSRSFTGILLDVSRLEQEHTFLSDAPRKQWDFWSILSPFSKRLALVGAISLVIQLSALFVPYLVKLGLDQAMTGRADGVAVWSLLIVVIASLQGVLNYQRSGVSAGLSTDMRDTISTRIARAMMFSDYASMSRAGVGRIISKMGSVGQIREIVSSQAVSVLADVVSFIVVAGFLVYFSPVLGLISLSVSAVTAFVLLSIGRVSHGLQRRLMVANETEQSVLIENARGLLTIQLFEKQELRLGRWRGALITASQLEEKIVFVKGWGDIFGSTVSSVELCAILIAGVHLLSIRGISLGGFVAYMAYRQILSSKTPSVVKAISDISLARIHLDRLAELPRVADISRPPVVNMTHGISSICLTSISFRYSCEENSVLKELSLAIEAGDFIAISGRTGSGKSTLARIIAGVTKPDEGSVLINGLPIDKYGLLNYRRSVAVVLQDDILFEGSILDNITMFDWHPDFISAQKCAVDAQIHDEIVAFPMAYETLVSEGGSNLSGGQRQRLFLARALYKKPDVLIIDEGTANLDVATERAINDAIADTLMTRVVFAHRTQTIESARRHLHMTEGALVKIR